MDKLSDILLKSMNSDIKEGLLLKRAFKDIVNEKIESVTTDVEYKNRVLFIYVKDNVWATQLMQYKHTILKRAKLIVPKLKEIKITASYLTENKATEAVQGKKKTNKDITDFLLEINQCDKKYRAALKNIIMRADNNHQHVCVACGSPVLSASNNFCSLCISQNTAIKSKEIQILLKETPWIKYEEIEQKQRKNTNYEGFMQEKKFKINKIRDIIENEYFYIKNDKKAKNEFFKSKIEELVILKLSIEPSELTEQIIENNIPKKWFKLYQS